MREIKFGSGFGGMPRVSVDPTIRVPQGRYHTESTPRPDPPSMEHIKIAFDLAQAMLEKLKPVWQYLEIIKVFFHLSEDDPTTVFVCCEVVMTEPLTGQKSTFRDDTSVLRKDDVLRREPISVPDRVELLSGVLLNDVREHLKHRGPEFDASVLEARKLHEAFA